MPGIGTDPAHLTCLQSQIGDTGGKLTPDRTQYHRHPAAASQRRQLAQLGILYPPGNLGVETRDPLEQGGGHPSPAHWVGTPHDDESLWSDAGFPRCRWAQPAPCIQVHNGSGRDSPRQHRQPDPGQPKTGVTDEPGDPSRLGSEQVPPRWLNGGSNGVPYRCDCRRHLPPAPFLQPRAPALPLGTPPYRTYVRCQDEKVDPRSGHDQPGCRPQRILDIDSEPWEPPLFESTPTPTPASSN